MDWGIYTVTAGVVPVVRGYTLSGSIGKAVA